MLRSQRLRFSLAAACVAALGAATWADVPRQISYQGRLTGNGDDPVNLQIRFYDAEIAGNELFLEQHDAVPRPSGLFSINIGSQTTGGVPDSALDYTSQNPNSEGLWLGVKVWDGSQWVELAPRTRIVMVPYAAKAMVGEQLVKPGTFDPAVEVASDGNIGIGTVPTSLAKLHIVRPNGDPSTPGAGNLYLNGDEDDAALLLGVNGTCAFLQSHGSKPLAINPSGDYVGIGTGTPRWPLEVRGELQVRAISNDRLVFAADPVAEIVVANVLQITGGSDLAEPFVVAKSSAATEPAKLGMVVVIDPDNPGQLKLATEAYDRKVAGIISGANGLQPGMVMTGLRPEAVSHQPSAVSREGGSLRRGSGQVPGRSGEAIRAGSVSDRSASDASTGPALTFGARTQEHPVALTGRVWCWCDASYGAIEPGDMLTTSATPGHAMKVSSHAQAFGSVIGKAMTPLKCGKGLVLVLVNLQ